MFSIQNGLSLADACPRSHLHLIRAETSSLSRSRFVLNSEMGLARGTHTSLQDSLGLLTAPCGAFGESATTISLTLGPILSGLSLLLQKQGFNHLMVNRHHTRVCQNLQTSAHILSVHQPDNGTFLLESSRRAKATGASLNPRLRGPWRQP